MQYRNIWLVDCQFRKEPGQRPTPEQMTAQDFHSGRRWSEPSDPGTDTLVVVHNAPDVLGCYLALGRPMPSCVLDLQAEFRCLTSGLPEFSDDLAAALAYFGLPENGDRIDCIARLLPAMLPSISLGHAVLRGRYLAAVARMEWTGTPIDVEAFIRLRDGWVSIQDTLIGEVDRDYQVYEGQQFRPRLWAAWVTQQGISWPRLASGRLDLRLDAFREMAHVYPAVRPMRQLRATLALMRSFGLAVGPDGRNRCSLRLGVSKAEADRLLRLHRGTYPTYWRWSREVGRVARRDRQLRATFGWTLHVELNANPRSVRNFPLQANAAEMLRLACISLTEAGVRVCAPVHDALLIEAPVETIEEAVAVCESEMQRASELVLSGFPLRTETKVVRCPERYADARGQKMWDLVFQLLDQEAGLLHRCNSL
jgi:hypothetical protein